MTHVPFSYLALRAGSDDVAQALSAPEALAAIRWSRRSARPVVFSYMGIRRGASWRLGAGVPR